METLIYLAKTNLYLILFYCCYWLFFRQHTFFQWNRIYLLGSIAASFLLPAIVFYTESTAPAAASAINEVAVTAANVTAVPEETSTWPALLLICYGAGAFVMLFQLLKSFRQIFLLVKKGKHIPVDEYTLVFLDPEQFRNKDCGSFSFFKWMIVNREDYTNNPDTILRHEHVHIRQWHSVDILLIELLKVVFWVNPVLWFYKRSLQAVHEYLADTEAANRDRYAHFLVSYALKVPEQLLTNHFSNSSLLKERIKMIYKNRTSNWLLSKYLLILPLIIVTVFLTAARKYIPQPTVNEANTLPNIALIRGTVSDQSGKRIPGANVVVKNTYRGAATDREGNFELENVGENAVMVVSHIQFKSKEIAVKKGKVSYDVVMEPDNTVLKGSTINAESALAKPAADKSTSTVAEQKPEFPGGYEAMLEYLRTNTKYPTPALKANVEGVVIVRFTVDKEGGLNSVVIVKGVGFGLDAESIRLVKNMPKWKPGIQNGEPLAMAQTIEIKFDLASAKGDKRQGFHLPQSSFALNFKIAKVEVEDLFGSTLAFFEDKTFKPSVNPPTSEYRYTPGASSYQFMNYNTGASYTTYGIRPTGAVKFQKQADDQNN